MLRIGLLCGNRALPASVVRRPPLGCRRVERAGLPNDCPRWCGESSSRNKAISWMLLLQPGSANERGVVPSATTVETGSGFGKIDAKIYELEGIISH
uniref:Uncharacterized protein n=1 Tax=Oryza sativa subsp. japonica TaxID=39947 RepID=Q7EZ50_ORYSJ|nr:hypothetical protein [Oryza sativa Japonica Group]